MANNHENEVPIDRVIILFLFGLLLLVSPVIHWWLGESTPWYTPYLVWGGLILLIWRLQSGERST